MRRCLFLNAQMFVLECADVCAHAAPCFWCVFTAALAQRHLHSGACTGALALGRLHRARIVGQSYGNSGVLTVQSDLRLGRDTAFSGVISLAGQVVCMRIPPACEILFEVVSGHCFESAACRLNSFSGLPIHKCHPILNVRTYHRVRALSNPARSERRQGSFHFAGWSFR